MINEKLANGFVLISTAFLITGQLIGAGILGIPVVVGLAGLIPGLFIMLIYGCGMFFSALILGKEAADKADPIFNFPSLYQEYLGNFAKWIAIAINMIMLYGLLIAYIAAGSLIISGLFDLSISHTWIIIMFFFLITSFTITGVNFVRKYSVILVVLMWCSFIVLILMGAPHLNPKFFEHADWLFLPMTIPVVATSFNFCNLIPVVTKSLKWKMSSIWKAIFIGMIIAYAMNAVWLLVGVGIIPLHSLTNGNGSSLVNAYLKNNPSTIPMAKLMLSSAFMTFSLVFSILAITTSYVANGIGLMSFNKDLIVNFAKTRSSRVLVVLVTFIPPLLITLKYPDIFIKALGITGGICTICLFGVLPGIIAIIKYKNFVRYLGICSLIIFLFALVCQVGIEVGTIKIALP